MITKKTFTILLMTTLISTFSFDALCWDNEKTHQDLSRIATERSLIGTANILSRIGLEGGLEKLLILKGKTKQTIEWLQQGADLEDAGNIRDLALGRARSYNHFHNPLKQLDQAGLNDFYAVLNPYPPFIPFVYPMSGESALVWAQDPAYQKQYIKLYGRTSGQSNSGE